LFLRCLELLLDLLLELLERLLLEPLDRLLLELLDLLLLELLDLLLPELLDLLLRELLDCLELLELELKLFPLSWLLELLFVEYSSSPEFSSELSLLFSFFITPFGPQLILLI
jgi:hypothetical protein